MRALISVENKEGLVSFAQGLHALGIELISTGRTAAALAAASIPVKSVSELTGFPEILGGRVKTLHPAIHGGILAKRDQPDHMRQLDEHGIEPIDLVVCNLYPFVETISQPGVTLEQALEQIDIGGITLLRAAAKNFLHVTVVTRPQDYERVLLQLQEQGAVPLEMRQQLAVDAFQHTALYDTYIASYLRQISSETQGEAAAEEKSLPADEQQQDGRLFPDEFTIPLEKIQPLRYGENPHQSGAFYAWKKAGVSTTEDPGTPAQGRKSGSLVPSTSQQMATVAGAQMLQGKELSFNNILDLDAALNTVASFTAPTAVIIKHTNPCGLACGQELVEAYRHAHQGDTVSAYGGIIGFNRTVDEATAAELAPIFYEAIIAPGYTPQALEILRRKRNLRLLATNTHIGPPALKSACAPWQLDVRRVSGGLLVQTPDLITAQELQYKVVSEREPTLDEATDLLFAWKAVKHVKSNAIVLAKKLMVIGVGAGQTNRVYSVQIAVDKAADRARGSVLASDAYFPFPDGVEAAAKAGVTAIIQPGGSIRDEESIRMANRYAIAMLTTGQRHFRH
jgi:phosphoribosylaminoimidazolecarboxamide formyltransferase/IMP cyclohydrolase